MKMSKTIRTDKNVWTFDLRSRKGIWYITSIYGDVSDASALREAVEVLRTMF
jgi:hypothetical protein